MLPIVPQHVNFACVTQRKSGELVAALEHDECRTIGNKSANRSQCLLGRGLLAFEQSGYDVNATIACAV